MNTLNTTKIAQNTFSDGLIMDFNDLLMPSSAYTNCLNGTCITYNGNEFVLQNDMGNGRVETAYLPAGYVPVGVKEYGGIIYIASVNPLTNECQLGSFPSPSNFENESPTKGEWNTLTMSDQHDKLVTHKQVALGNDNVLLVGDKFALCLLGMDFDTARKLLSHCSNYNGLKIKSPKNKTFTLQLMVENNNHHLIDITSQLDRYNRHGNKLTGVQLQDRGYFLQLQEGDTLVDPKNINITVDSLILSNTSTKYEQVYKGKVGGTLYLVCTINSVSQYQAQWIDLKNVIKEELETLEQNAAETRPGFDEDEMLSPEEFSERLQKPNPEDPIPFANENNYSINPSVKLVYNSENAQIPYIKIERAATLLNNEHPDTIATLTGLVISFKINESESAYFYTYNNTIESSPSLALDTKSALKGVVNDGNTFYIFLLGQKEVSNILKSSNSITITDVHIFCSFTGGIYIQWSDTEGETYGCLNYNYFGSIVASKLHDETALLYFPSQDLWAVQVSSEVELTNYKFRTLAGKYILNNDTEELDQTETEVRTASPITINNESYLIDDCPYNNFIYGNIGQSKIYEKIKVTLDCIIGTYSFTLGDSTYSVELELPPTLFTGSDDNPIEWTRQDYDALTDPLPYKFIKKQPTFNLETIEELTLLKLLFYDSTGINIDPSQVQMLVMCNKKLLSINDTYVAAWVYTPTRLKDPIELQKHNTEDDNIEYYYLNLDNENLRKGNVMLGITIPLLGILENKTGWIIIPEDSSYNKYCPTGTLLLNYYYNCPDGIYSAAEVNDGTDKYASILGKKENFWENPTLMGTRLYLNPENENTSTQIDIALPKDVVPTYDENTDLYHLQQEVTYNFSDILNNGKGYSFDTLPKITYRAYPFLNFGLGEMDLLVQQGTIEFLKVGSGELQLNAWKYYWDTSTLEITIVWGVDNYLRSTQDIMDVQFNFYLLHSSLYFSEPDVILTPEHKTYYSGTFTDLFATQEQFEENNMYLVQIKCKIKENNIVTDAVIGYRWLLASSAFNSAFSNTSISDFISEDLGTKSVIDDIRTIKVTIDPVVTLGAIDKTDTITYEYGTNNTVNSLLFLGTQNPPGIAEKNDVTATITENVQDHLEIRCQLSWDIEGLPVDGILYEDINNDFIKPSWNIGIEGGTATQGAVITKPEDNYIILPYTLTLSSKKTYEGLKISPAILYTSSNIPVYQLYKDYCQDQIMPGMLVYGYVHEKNKHDAYVRIEVYKLDPSEEPEFKNSYLTTDTTGCRRLVQYDPADLGDDNQNIIKDVVGTIYNITDTAEGFYINWGQGYANSNQTLIGYENLFIYMLRCDDGQEGTPKYVAASTTLYTKPSNFKYTTIWDTCYPDLSNALIKLRDETADASTNAGYYCTVKNPPTGEGFLVAPLVTLGININQVQFTRNYNGDTASYNDMIDTCKNNASNLENIKEFLYIWGKMKLLFTEDSTISKTVILDPISFKAAMLLPTDKPSTSSLSKITFGTGVAPIYTFDITDLDKVYKYEGGAISEAPNILQVDNVLRIKPNSTKEYIKFLSIGAGNTSEITSSKSADSSWLKVGVPAASKKYRFSNTESQVYYEDSHKDVERSIRGGYPDTGTYNFKEAAGTLVMYKHKVREYIELGHIHT